MQSIRTFNAVTTRALRLWPLVAALACVGTSTAQTTAEFGAPGPARADPAVLVIAAPSGGSLDVIGNILAPQLSAAFGRPFAIRNDATNEGIEALNLVAAGSAHEIRVGLATRTPIVAGRLIGKGADYQPMRDFEWLGVVARYGNAVVIRAADPARSFEDWLKRVRSAPELIYGAGPVGAMSHLAGQMLAEKTGTRFTHRAIGVPDTGYEALRNREIDVFIDGLPNALEETRKGAVRILAVTSSRRAPAIPGVPAFGEIWAGEDFSVLATLLVAAAENEATRYRLRSAWFATARSAQGRSAFERVGAEFLGVLWDDADDAIASAFVKHAALIARFSRR